MGNLSFLHPTDKIEEFNMDKFLEILKKDYPKLNIKYDEKFNQISVWSKDDSILYCEFFVGDNYIVTEEDLKRDLEELKLEGNGEDYKNLKRFDEEVKDKNICLQVSHGSGYDFKQRNLIVKSIKRYFNAYWLDEGIHPELMLPEEHNY